MTASQKKSARKRGPPKAKPNGQRNELKDEVKVYLVTRNAQFVGPQTVADEVKERFGLEIPKQQAERYDPTKYNGRELARPLKALFEAERKRYTADIASVPIANQKVRLARLDEMAEDARSRKNHGMASKLLEQAAKECGNAYTNKVEHGGEIKTTPPFDLSGFSADELRAWRGLMQKATPKSVDAD